MEILLQCPLCKFSFATHPDKNQFGVNYYTIYNTDSNICEVFDAPGNHSTAIYLTNYKFHLLYESAVYAMKDMYFREAVATLNSALERFFEFAIYILTFKESKDLKVKGWKFVANQSERQLGAYYFLFFSKFHILPETLNNNETAFRNNVIHKGYFPTKEETYIYAKRICTIISNSYRILEENLQEDLTEYNKEFVKELWTNCLNFCEKEGRLHPNNIKEKFTTTNYKFVKRPFERRIKTFLFESKDFTYRDIKNLESYIKDITSKVID